MKNARRQPAHEQKSEGDEQPHSSVAASYGFVYNASNRSGRSGRWPRSCGINALGERVATLGDSHLFLRQWRAPPRPLRWRRLADRGARLARRSSGRLFYADGALNAPRETIPRLSGKEGAKDVPEYCEGQRPMIRESGKDFADRVGEENYKERWYPKNNPRHKEEFNKMKKYGDRNFRSPPGFFDKFNPET